MLEGVLYDIRMTTHFKRDHNELRMHLGHGHFLLSHEDAIHRLNAAHNVYAISNAEIF